MRPGEWVLHADPGNADRTCVEHMGPRERCEPAHVLTRFFTVELPQAERAWETQESRRVLERAIARKAK